ncbi:MerR family transcriptional regulator [Patescibacteria group bacterium]|nr:MerR family transcriptional regulator [Patescibacteria group bacterium]
MKPRSLTISEAAEIIGVHPNTLRNWEKKGIMVPDRDPETNYRYYHQEQVKAFLLRGGVAKLKIWWGYENTIKRRVEDFDKVKNTLDICVSGTVTTHHDKSVDKKLDRLRKEALEKGVEIRFIRDLKDPIQEERADVAAKMGIETRNCKVDGMSFAIRDKEVVGIELPSDNPDHRLCLFINDKGVAKSFSLFFDMLWDKGSRPNTWRV